MFIDPKWRILTVGDGDLSFSSSLFYQYEPRLFTASVYDSIDELAHKYGLTHFNQLKQNQVEVLFEFDVTDKQSVNKLSGKYDLVIFQFPLIPNFKSKSAFSQMKQTFGDDFSINTLNRRLLRLFIFHCLTEYLDLDGERLIYISSKDVKPYTEWNIEHRLTQNLSVNYLGKCPFNAEQFPDYQIRNVDRDKFVKDTKGQTYVWSDKSSHESCKLSSFVANLTPFQPKGENGCDLCNAGIFSTDIERTEHEKSKKHQRMLVLDQQWQQYLNNH